MSSRVRLLNVTRVQPACTTGADDHELSFLDTMHIGKIPIQRLFFFDGTSLPPFTSVVSTLRSSLADTLAVFSTLAGELTFRPSSGTVVVNCSTAAVSTGVRFVEAEYLGSTDDMRRLAREDEHDTEAFLQLVPDIDVTQLPAPVLAVQVTRPATGHGAVAVGVTILHEVADGQAVWQFMRAWSTASREGGAPPWGLMPPTFDRTAIQQYPMAVELSRMFLRFHAPALPLLRSPSSLPTAPATLDTAQQSRRTFVLTADQIQSLKQECIPQSEAACGQPPTTTTTYVAVSSLVWASLVRAKSMDHAGDAHFKVVADCRHRLRPPPGEGYFGNCVRPFFAKANVGDLCGEGGLARAAAAIRERVRENLDQASDPLEGMERLLEVFRGIPKERLASVGSSHRFMAYETDFGWGAPSRVELVSMFRAELVMLLGARERGAVQVSVALSRPLMEAFAVNFHALAGSRE